MWVVVFGLTLCLQIKSMAKLLDQKSLSNKVSLNVLLKKKGWFKDVFPTLSSVHMLRILTK